MKTLKLALIAGVIAVTPAAALAQDVGATIYGSDGNAVGTVAEVDAHVILIDTGTHKAPVPVAMVFDGDKGKSVNATRAQVDTMMAERLAEAVARRDAALVQGAAVVSSGGRTVGTLTKVDLAADTIILETAEGALQMKKEHFAVNPQGQLAVLYSREQIASAAKGGSAAATGGGAM